MWITIITIFLLTLVALIVLVAIVTLMTLLFGLLEENYPRFTNWVVLPLGCVFAFLVVLADVGSWYLENWGPEDAVEIVDCSAPDIQCVNVDGDHR